MTKDDEVYIRHIQEDIQLIEQYSHHLKYSKFLEDKLIQDGIIRRLEIIGEAVRNLSEEFFSRFTEIPWRDWIGMRHKLIHGYFGVDLEIVWNTFMNDLPPLKNAIEEALKDYD